LNARASKGAGLCAGRIAVTSDAVQDARVVVQERVDRARTHADSGRAKALAVSSRDHQAIHPYVPSVAETGIGLFHFLPTNHGQKHDQQEDRSNRRKSTQGIHHPQNGTGTDDNGSWVI
jgi:hypothetical protein